MKNQLIIFYGSSPGAGKSTLSSFLFEQLSSNNTPVQWIYEEDILHLDLFRSSIDAFQNRKLEQIMPALLTNTAAFVQSCLTSGKIAITDSIFPFFNWLIATNDYSMTQLETFSRALERILEPLNPLVVYLDVDSEKGLKRATQQRGQAWYDELQQRVGQYGHNKNKNLQTLKEIAAYFDLVNQQNIGLLSCWTADTLIFDANQHTVETLKQKLLHHLGLSPEQISLIASRDELHSFVGVYQCQNEDIPIANPLIIALVDGVLKVNAYWPVGCPLMVEEKGQFRLKDTSHRIEFASSANKAPQWLIYDDSGNRYQYQRIA